MRTFIGWAGFSERPAMRKMRDLPGSASSALGLVTDEHQE